MRLIVILAILVMAISVAEGAKRGKRPPISIETCQQIRDAVAAYGIATVEAGATARGYTLTQIRQARAYCK